MQLTLPPDLREQLQQELSSGLYRGSDDLIEQAIRRFLDEAQRGRQRLESLRRIGHAVDQAGLYDRVILPNQQ